MSHPPGKAALATSSARTDSVAAAVVGCFPGRSGGRSGPGARELHQSRMKALLASIILARSIASQAVHERLCRAVLDGDLRAVDQALAMGARVEARTLGRPALMIAVDMGDPDMVQGLLERGASPLALSGGGHPDWAASDDATIAANVRQHMADRERLSLPMGRLGQMAALIEAHAIRMAADGAPPALRPVRRI